MGFDFNAFLTPWVVGAVILLITFGLSAEALNNAINGLSNSSEDWFKLGVNLGIFLIFLVILLVPSVKNNINKIINTVFDYPMKIVNNFFK